MATGYTVLSLADFTSLCSQTASLLAQDCCALASTVAVALLAAGWGEDANCSALWLFLQTPASLIIH